MKHNTESRTSNPEAGYYARDTAGDVDPEVERAALADLDEAESAWRARCLAAWRATGYVPDRIRWTPPANDTESPRPGTLLTVRASEVVIVAIDWIWRNWIPCGALTSCQGQMGSSKGTWLADLAARVTRGDAMPDGTHGNLEGPADVIWLSGEDDPKLTLVPRFMVANADLGRIHIVKGVIAEDGSVASVHSASLENVERLRELLERTGARLIVVDTLTCFTGGKDVNRSTEMRQLLGPLEALAAEMSVAIVLVRHMKKEAASALNAAGGSVDISALCRSVLVTGEPEPPEADDSSATPVVSSTARVIASAKNNLGPKPKAFGFEVTPHTLSVPTRNGGQRDEEFPAVTWGREIDTTADAVNARGQGVPAADGAPKPSKAKQAQGAILDALSDSPNGWLPAKDLESAVCETLQCRPSTYRSALPGLKTKSAVWMAKREGKSTIYGLWDADVPEGFVRERAS